MHQQRAHRREDAGLSMVEIVISMFLVGILSLAVLPLIIGITQHSALNRELVSATSVAQQHLTRIQAAFPSDPGERDTTCSDLTSRQTSAGSPIEAEDGLEVSVDIGACPSDYPGSVPVTIVVEREGKSRTSITSSVRVARAA